MIRIPWIGPLIVVWPVVFVVSGLVWDGEPAGAQTVREVFEKVAPSVAVIRARGRDVDAGGRDALHRDRVGRADLGGRQGDDGGPRRARHGRDRGGVPRRRDGLGARGGVRAGGRPVAPAARSGAAGREGGADGRLQHDAGGRPGRHRGGAVRAELLAERGVHQRAVGAQHGLQDDAHGRVLPDRRRHQHRQLGRAHVQHEGRGHRDRQPQHLQGRGQRGAGLRGDGEHGQAAPAREAVVLGRPRRVLPDRRGGRSAEPAGESQRLHRQDGGEELTRRPDRPAREQDDREDRRAGGAPGGRHHPVGRGHLGGRRQPAKVRDAHGSPGLRARRSR